MNYFQQYLDEGDEVKTVDVCSPDCCSYTKENELSSDQCHGGCDVTSSTTPASTTPECEMASLYYHPPATMDPYW